MTQDQDQHRIDRNQSHPCKRG